MDAQSISHLLLEYRYLVLIPLATIEGPIVAFVAGTLASLRYFNIYALAAVFFIRDVGLDAIYYYVGYVGGNTSFVQRAFARLGINQADKGSIKARWEKKPGITMLIGKLSYGIAQFFIMAAGTVRMRFGIFFKYGALVAVLQYWTLLALGYFFGQAFGGSLPTILDHLQLILGVVGLVIASYYLFTWRMRKRFLSSSRASASERQAR